MVSAAHEPHDHTNHGAFRVSNALAPDYLRVAPGAPHEQAFVEEITPGLFNIGVIRMSGGLFNFLLRKSRMSSSRGPPGDPTYLVADPSAARATLNFRPAYSDLATIICPGVAQEGAPAENGWA